MVKSNLILGILLLGLMLVIAGCGVGTTTNDAPVITGIVADFNATVNVSYDLWAVASDDGNPVPPGELTYEWSVSSGNAGDVLFGDASAANTTVVFLEPGDYSLMFTVSDSKKESTKSVNVNAVGDEPVKLEIVSAVDDGEVHEDANPIINAFDGDLNTRWSSRPLPINITFDLGTVKNVGQTDFLFYEYNQSRVYQYSVSVSIDGNSWDEVVSQSDSKQGWTSDNFTPVSARYVRLSSISQNTKSDWAGLWEAEIWSNTHTWTKDQIESKIHYPSPDHCPEGYEYSPVFGDCVKIIHDIGPLPTCYDNIQNQGETGVDCGGPCHECENQEPTCDDGIKNQDETGIDCGGKCPPCNTDHILGDGTTYYVSTSGNDNNDGLSEQKPIKSLSKVNSLELKPGDNVLFKRGNIWQEENGVALLAHTSGTESDRITYSNYDTGDLPVITLVSEIDGWKDPSKWTKYTGAKDKNGNVYPDVWVMKYPSKENTVQISRSWLNKGDGLYEPVYGNWHNWEDNEGVAAYDNLDGTFFVNPTHEFSYKKPSSELFVYSPNNINPANYYTEMKYPGGIDVDEGNHPWDWSDHTVELRNADYVTIDGLDMRGGSYSTMGIAGSDYVIIRNNKIGDAGAYAALTVGVGKNAKKAKADSSNYGQIYDNVIDSKYPAPMHVTHSAFQLIVDCIILSNEYEEVSYWDIHDNYLHDWGVGLLVLDSFESGYHTQYHKFHDNTVEMEHESYTKPFQYSNEYNKDSFPPTYIRTYNNIFKGYNVHAQVASDGNIVYNNIFMNARDVLNSHDSGGDGIDQQTGARDNVYIGNTFYDTYDAVFRWMSGNAIIANNLLVDTSKKTKGLSQIYSVPTYASYQNNLFNYPDLTENDKVFYDTKGKKSLSITEFEKASNGMSSGNFVFEGEKSELINSDLTIPAGSPAIGAGIDVSEWVPEGFRDMNGNLVNRHKPTLGALEYK